ncbi:hypothetical protein CVS44_11760 [Staphylococcus haemolyticus]|uniref:Mobilization protein n=1 Tax=Staphylococcus massiliensis S46 TaxID=1229783 RepID=K9ACS2_9STAP|nr:MULTISPECIES: hypothetical protein [Staphylococcus]EKU45134.1 hypothetical protein C273_11625 [Staphylococcus massiliensis S46]MBJ8241518.1 hypothetical protein [Staphylococcus pseudintermedius]PNH22636.1 hypothetical protein CVS44_11760 [Staphylococcus haemolyticus]HCV5888881.1 hypothetical protein [Staphylococcus aureus]
MEKAKLRMVFDIILLTLVLGYFGFGLFTDYLTGNAKWSLIFVGILVVIRVLKEIIAPKQKSSDNNGND